MQNASSDWAAPALGSTFVALALIEQLAEEAAAATSMALMLPPRAMLSFPVAGAVAAPVSLG